VFVFVSLIIATSAQILYNNFLFDDNLIKINDVLIFAVLLFLYLIFLLTVVLFSSVTAKSITPATFIAFLIFIAVSLSGSIPKIGKYTPPEIINFGILTQAKSISDLTASIIITVLCSVILLVLSIMIFKRQEL